MCPKAVHCPNITQEIASNSTNSTRKFKSSQTSLEYQQNKFSLEFLSSLKSPNLHHIRSADFWLMSADLIWCKLGNFNQDKTAD